MIDREKVLAVLQKRFPGSSPEQVAAAANAIVGLDDEWVDVTEREAQMGYHFSVQCGEICFLADQVQQGAQFRLLMRRPTEPQGSILHDDDPAASVHVRPRGDGEAPIGQRALRKLA